MKAAPKKRKPRLASPLPFPRSAPATAPAPRSTPPSPFGPRAHEWALEALVIRNGLTREERVLNPGAWAPSGLTRIPVSTIPFRPTVRDYLRQTREAVSSFLWHARRRLP